MTVVVWVPPALVMKGMVRVVVVPARVMVRAPAMVPLLVPRLRLFELVLADVPKVKLPLTATVGLPAVLAPFAARVRALPNRCYSSVVDYSELHRRSPLPLWERARVRGATESFVTGH